VPVLTGEDTALDPYAAEHPGEFFAVMSEAFFETPGLLKSEYPAVYQKLSRYFGQDPAEREAQSARSVPLLPSSTL
jgi:Mlc titration factor MtfA (ptsG expression regulator)